MADIYGSHFEFAGVSSRELGLIIANVNTSRSVSLGGPKEGVTIFSRAANKQYLIDDDYSSSPVLFNHRDYRRLYLDIDDDVYGETYEYIDGEKKRNYLNCRFINPERVDGNGYQSRAC